MIHVDDLCDVDVDEVEVNDVGDVKNNIVRDVKDVVRDVGDVDDVCDVDEVGVDDVGDVKDVGGVIYVDEVNSWIWQQFFDPSQELSVINKLKIFDTEKLCFQKTYRVLQKTIDQKVSTCAGSPRTPCINVAKHRFPMDGARTVVFFWKLRQTLLLHNIEVGGPGCLTVLARVQLG